MTYEVIGGPQGALLARTKRAVQAYAEGLEAEREGKRDVRILVRGQEYDVRAFSRAVFEGGISDE